jgi:Protein of unknown function (DUF2380)
VRCSTLRDQRLIALAVLVALEALVAPPHAEEPRPTAVFPVELLDTSGEGEKPGQAERLALATRTLTQALEQSGRYQAVDLAPHAEEVKATEPRYRCDGCWKAVAKKAGAAVAVIAVVHKVSTLISTMDIWIADIETETYVAHVDGQIRGDTDTAYVRGVQFLVNDRLLGK